MSVDASVSGSSSQILALAERNVFTIGVLVAFGQTEIDDENVILVSIVSTDQEVIGLNISVNDSFFMHLLNSLNLF